MLSFFLHITLFYTRIELIRWKVLRFCMKNSFCPSKSNMEVDH